MQVYKDPVIQQCLENGQKTSLTPEVLTDHEVSETITQMYPIRKKNLHGIFVELFNLHGPDQLFSMNLWYMCEAICSQDNLPGCYWETVWKSLSFGAFKMIVSSSGSGN